MAEEKALLLFFLSFLFSSSTPTNGFTSPGLDRRVRARQGGSHDHARGDRGEKKRRDRRERKKRGGEGRTLKEQNSSKLKKNENFYQSSPDLFSLAGNPKSRSFLEPKGYYAPDVWDYLFSARGTCERARAALSLGSSSQTSLPKTPSSPPISSSSSPFRIQRSKKKKILSCVPGARRALTSKAGLAATLEGAGLFRDPKNPSSGDALLPLSVPLARPGAAWDAAGAVALRLGGGPDGSEWALKSGGHRGKGVEMLRGGKRKPEAEAAAARAAATAARASLSRRFRLWPSLSGYSSTAAAASSVLQAAVSPQATVDGGRRFYLRVLFALVADNGGGGGGSLESPAGEKSNGEEEIKAAAAAAAAAAPRGYLYRGGIVIAESRLKEEKETDASEKASERRASPSQLPPSNSTSTSPSCSSSKSKSESPASSALPVVNMWLHDPRHVAVWRFRDLAEALDGGGSKVGKERIAAAAGRGIEQALGLALAAAAPLLADASASHSHPSSSSLSSSTSLPAHLSVELLGADFVLTPEGRAALLEINELPSLARLRKGGKVDEAAAPAAELAFDAEKERVVSALMRFLSGVGEEGTSEVEAARAAGLKPLSEAVEEGRRTLEEIQKKKREKCQKRRGLARRLFFESAVGDAAAALLARASPRLLVLAAELAARAGLVGPEGGGG